MKITGISFLALAAILLIAHQAEAQPSVHFVAPTVSVEPGSNFSANIRVAGFQEIVGTQFSMTWDPEVLRFEGIENMALSITVPDNFGLMGTESGLLTFSWFDPTLSGMNLPDSAILYAIRFQTIGDAGDNSSLAFGNIPTVKEVVDTTFVAIEAAFHDGDIAVLSPNSIAEISIPRLQVSESMPNPVKESASFLISLKESTHLEWAVFDIQGRRLFSKEGTFNPGEHSLTIDAGKIREPGTYYCRFYLGDGSFISRKLIKI